MKLLATLFTAVLFALKLAGIIAVSWWVVAAPALVYVDLVVLIFVVGAVLLVAADIRR